MPSETDRQIEQLLQAYGRRRRKIGRSTWEMPPTTRERLHTEITLHYARPGEPVSPVRSWLFAWRPRLAWGVAAVAVAVAGGLLWLRRSPPETESVHLAQALPPSTVPQLPAPVSAPPESRTRPAAANPSSRVSETSMPMDPLRSSLPTAETQYAMGLESPGPANAALAAKTAATEETTTPKTSPVVLTFTSGVASQTASAVTVTNALAAQAQRLRFTQTKSSREALENGRPRPMRRISNPAPIKTKARNGASSAPPASLLTLFDYEQQGDQVWIRDGDGSVYAGMLRVPASGPSGEMRSRSATLASASLTNRSWVERAGAVYGSAPFNGISGAPGAFFQVTGTNLTLGKLVTVEGGFVRTEGPPQSRPTQVDRASKSPATNPGSAAPAQTNWQQRLKLQGHWMVGGTNRVDFEAVEMESPNPDRR